MPEKGLRTTRLLPAGGECQRLEISMAAFALCRGRWPGAFLASALAAIVWVAAALPQAAFAADPLTVHLDQATILKLPERTATLVIGNPLIADAVVQAGGIAVITAKSYGATNLVALDGSGSALMQRAVRVVGPTDPIVVVYRGAERESYSCMPNCERRITIGDTATYFSANLGQVGTLSAQAQGHK
jgi:Flp pilus assembly secretin CpaC